MPFKETDEGQTHYYGDGCSEHPAKLNLREVIEKKKREMTEIYSFTPSQDSTNDNSLCIKVEVACLLLQEALSMQLDAVVDELRYEQYEAYDDYTTGRNACAYELTEKLKQAREDITSLQ